MLFGDGTTVKHFAVVTVTGAPGAEADGGGFAWGLWGPVIGGSVVVALAAAAGFAWWTRRSQQP